MTQFGRYKREQEEEEEEGEKGKKVDCRSSLEEEREQLDVLDLYLLLKVTR